MSEEQTKDVLGDLGALIARELGDQLLSQKRAFGELSLIVEMGSIVKVMRFLRDDLRTSFVSFVDMCGVDYPGREQRFDIVYHLMSPKYNTRIRVTVSTDEKTAVPSITNIFPAAEWFEREAWDMYGILFSGHPDLRRLLTDYGFDGHPLRKDFPLTGFVETRYDDELKRVVYEPVELRQEFRNFDFLSPWEGADYVLPGDEKADEEAGEKAS